MDSLFYLVKNAYLCIMIEYIRNEVDKYIERYEEPSHHISALLKASIITLDIRPRILYPLWEAGMRTVKDLLCFLRSDIKNVRNIGVAAEKEIIEILRRANLADIEF